MLMKTKLLIVTSYQLNECCFQNKTTTETIFLHAFDPVETMLYCLQDCGNIKIASKLYRNQQIHQLSSVRVSQE